MAEGYRQLLTRPISSTELSHPVEHNHTEHTLSRRDALRRIAQVTIPAFGVILIDNGVRQSRSAEANLAEDTTTLYRETRSPSQTYAVDEKIAELEQQAVIDERSGHTAAMIGANITIGSIGYGIMRALRTRDKNNERITRRELLVGSTPTEVFKTNAPVSEKPQGQKATIFHFPPSGS